MAAEAEPTMRRRPPRSALTPLALLGVLAGAGAGAPVAAQTTATIGNFVFYDADADGVQDPGEIGIGGVYLILRNVSNTNAWGAYTDATGAYSFSGMPPGDYYLEASAASCWGTTLSPLDAGGNDAVDSDFDPATRRTANFTAVAGSNLSWDLGITSQPVTVTGRVWEDADGDGIEDGGESGRSGVWVYFYGNSCTGYVPVQSDAAGNYAFAALPSGTQPSRSFRIEFSRPGDRFFTARDVGGDDTVDSDPDVAGLTGTVTQAPGLSVANLDAGLIPTSGGSATIGDRIWHDADADGIQDAGENGVGGVPFRLFSFYGGFMAQSFSSGTGAYAFAGMPPGEYRGRDDWGGCLGWTPAPKDQGVDDALDSDVDPASRWTDFFIAPAGTTSSLDLGITNAPASLSGQVWFDADGDGVRDPGESPVAGVTVTLDRLNCIGSTGLQATTQADGTYAFPSIAVSGAAISFRVRFSQPGGFFFTARDAGGDDEVDSDADPLGYGPSLVLTSGTAVTGMNAGLVPNTIGTASIGDRVWHDADGDGIQDAGEPNVGGTIVRLYSANGGYVADATANSDGVYSFVNRAPGDYYIASQATYCHTPPTLADVGGDDAVDNDVSPSTYRTPTFTAAIGPNPTWDYGLAQAPATVRGQAWHDDGDGVREPGEGPLVGVQVELRSWSCYGVYLTTVTRADGSYEFSRVHAGFDASRLYEIRFVQPSGLSYAPVDQGGDDTLDSDADPGNSGRTLPFPLTAGAVVENVDGGFTGTNVRTVGDFVWVDDDADGQQDAGEPGYEGATVRLLDSQGNLLGATATDANGNYQFGGLTQTTYNLEFVAPAGFAFTLPNQGSDTTDSDADVSTGRTGNFSVSSNLTSRDAGLVSAVPASVGDRVWLDLDEDGIQDGGEGGVAGVTVTLYRSSGVQVASDTTDAAGAYGFANLVPTDYYLVFSLPAGYGRSPQDQGGDDALDSDASPVNGQTAVFTLSDDEDETTIDAGLTPLALASVGDRVWADLDRDGVQDVFEPGLEGVAVTLFTSGGIQVATTATDEQGLYLFDNLAPGTFYLEFGLLADHLFSPWNVGSDSTDSDANPANGRTSNFSLSLGDEKVDVDCGMSPPDATSPKLLTIDSVADTGDGALSEGEATNAAITHLLLGFDSLLKESSAQSSNRYRLIRAGANGVLDSSSCAGGTLGDDVSVGVGTAAYDAVELSVTLDLPGSAPLADGLYLLLICGTLDDPAGNLFDGDGDGTGGDDFARTFRIDRTAPLVTAVGSDADTGDGTLAEDEPTNVAITALTLTFSEDLLAGDGSGADDAANPDNYLLTAPGPDGALETGSCADGLQDDDVEVEISAAAWDGPSKTATLTIGDGGTPLAEGRYRLLACGTTTLRDLVGNALDGNPGQPGTQDFAREFQVDTTAPVTLPAVSSPSHLEGGWTNADGLVASWSGAADEAEGTGLGNYWLLVDQSSGTLPPDGTTSVAHGTDPHGLGPLALGEGSWWVHVRPCDRAGNCAAGAAEAGFFGIDLTAPSDPGAIGSPSHATPSNATSIEVEWAGAADALSGVAGYWVALSASAEAEGCGGTVVSADAAETLTAPGAGLWYAHVCAIDAAGNVGPEGIGGPFEVDQGVPQVVAVDTVDSTADGQLVDGEETAAAIATFLVSFSEPMDAALAEQPTSYLLVGSGGDGTVETEACPAAASSDEAIAVDSAAYAAEVATVGVHGGVPLADGRYRLLVCGSLEDIAGNALDGDGDATGGDDFRLDFTVDTVAPELVSVRIADNGQEVTDGLATNADVTAFELDFDDTMLDPPGDSEAGDVTNPQSYRLVWDWAGAFETGDCDDEDPGDDLETAIDGVSWDGGAARASLAVGGGGSLPDGHYRLFVCGTLADGAGNPLAGGDRMRQFQIDRAGPAWPTSLFSTSHLLFTWSGSPQIAMLWSGASDGFEGSGVVSYAYAFDAFAASEPDGAEWLPHAGDPHGLVSPPLADGVWYFHVRACDAAGNCGATRHVGPYLIDTLGPAAPGAVVSPSHDGGPAGDPTIEIVWPPAADNASGLAGYAWEFSASSSWSCDEVEDGDEASDAATSPELGEGEWYFHLCARDNAGNWGGAGSYGPWAIDLTGPTVTGVDSVAAADWTQPGPAVVEAALTQLLVAFDEAMANAGAGSVLDAGNWLLVEAGGDLALTTADCSGAAGDDLAQPIAAVQYDSGLGLAALAVGPGSGLSAGSYRLLACPTLTDAAGNGLDGDGDGGAPEAFARDFTLTRTRHLANPNLDGGLDGWFVSGPVPEEWSLGAEDAEGRPFSGAARLATNAGAGGTWYLEQCVETIEPGAQGVSARVRIGSAEPGAPAVRAFLTWADAPACGGTWTELGESAPLAGGSGGGWLRLAVPPVEPPPGAVGFWLTLEVTGGAAESFTVEIDRALYPDAWSIFEDGFESGDTCIWSETVSGPACP